LIEFQQLQNIKSEPLSGSELMNRGFDFRNGGFIPEEQTKRAIFKFNYEEKKKYQVPGKQIYFEYPDEVDLTRISSHVEENNSSYLHTYSACATKVSNGISFGIGINVGVIGLGLKFGAEWGFIKQSLESKFKAGMTSLYYTSVYKLIAMPFEFMEIDKSIKMIFDRIPATPKSSTDMKYIEMLIQYYGGFFITEGVFGGKLDMFSFMTKEIIEQTNEKYTQLQASLTFRYKIFEISGGGFTNRSQIVIDKKFMENSESRIFFTGGIRNYQNLSTIKQWDNSIDLFQGLLKSKFLPISSLIEEPVKQKNLEQIIKVYSETGVIKPPLTSMLVNNLPKIPGYDLVGSGFDPVTMKPMRSVFNHDDEGFNKDASFWTNPFYNNLKFIIPSTMRIQQNTGSVESNETDVYYSKSEMEYKYFNQKTKKTFLGMGKKTTSVFKYHYYLDIQQRLQIFNSRFINWFNLIMNPLLYFNKEKKEKFMDPVLLMYINDYLPISYDKEKYRLLIETWGTHLITGVSMGGGITQSVYFKKDLLRTATIQEIKKQSSFSFLGLIKFKKYDLKSDKSLAQWFKDNVIEKVEYSGGRYRPGVSSLAEETPWEEFVKTVRESPDATNYDIVPLTVVIDNPAKKANLERAIEEYSIESSKIDLTKYYHKID
jgi:hypothetical protein